MADYGKIILAAAPGAGFCEDGSDMPNQNLRKQLLNRDSTGEALPNTDNHYEVSRDDLPLHCPLPGMSLWNSHPRVFIPVEADGHGRCIYCGATFRLVDRDGQ